MRLFRGFLIAVLFWVVVSHGARAGTTVTLALASGAIQHDFGEARKRERLVRTVVLRNTGDAAIEIGDVKHTCGGCSPVRLSGHGVAPGGTVKAVLRFDSGKNPGRQVRDIFLPVKQGERSGVLTLRSAWFVRAYLRCKPGEIRMGKIRWGEGAREKVTLITRDLKEAVRVLSVAEVKKGDQETVKEGGQETNSDRRIHIQSPLLVISEPMHRPANGDILVRFRVADDAPIGRFETELAIRTNYQEEPEIRVPVSGEVVGPFACDPPYAHFGVVGKGREATKEIRVTLEGRKAYHLEPVESEAEWLSVRLDSKGRREHVLTVALKLDAPVGRLRSTIRIRTDCPGQAAIELPVLALVRGK